MKTRMELGEKKKEKKEKNVMVQYRLNGTQSKHTCGVTFFS